MKNLDKKNQKEKNQKSHEDFRRGVLLREEVRATYEEFARISVGNRRSVRNEEDPPNMYGLLDAA